MNRIKNQNLVTMLRKVNRSKNREINDAMSDFYAQESFQSYIWQKTEVLAKGGKKFILPNVNVSKIAGLSFVCSPFRRDLHVIDLGGGGGIDYFLACELFRHEGLWTCIETEAMCSVASRKKTHPKALTFITKSTFMKEMPAGFEFNLYSNSALQYIPESVNVLDSILIKRPRRVAIMRTPFVIKGPEVGMLQKSRMKKNGPQVNELKSELKDIVISVRIEKLESIKELFEKHGYQLVCENIQDGSFTRKSKFARFSRSNIKTIDLLAWRMN